VNRGPFVDYYELLQVSANADEDTIHRVFRHLAKKYHPDGAEHGNAEHFNRLVEAHRTLTNPETRAAYDVRHQEHWNRTWKVMSEAGEPGLPGDDSALRDRLLALLYVQRRRNMYQPGMGEMDLARLVGAPLEHLEFHLWYLKEKGWLQRLDTGMHAITAQGVDELERQRTRVPQGLIEGRVAGDRQAKAPPSPRPA